MNTQNNAGMFSLSVVVFNGNANLFINSSNWYAQKSKHSLPHLEHWRHTELSHHCEFKTMWLSFKGKLSVYVPNLIADHALWVLTQLMRKIVVWRSNKDRLPKYSTKNLIICLGNKAIRRNKQRQRISNISGETWKCLFTGRPQPTWQRLRWSAEKNSKKSPNPDVKSLSPHTHEDSRL